ncbi:hypothetical protein SH139x_003811 [Planctomycetaceae bacterium SH139]
MSGDPFRETGADLTPSSDGRVGQPHHYLPRLSPAGIRAGYVRQCWLIVGWSWPALGAVLMAGGWWLRDRPGNQDLLALAGCIFAIAILGTAIQGAIYWILTPGCQRSRPGGAIVPAVIFTVFGAREPLEPLRQISAGQRWMQLVLGPLILFKIAIVLAMLELIRGSLTGGAVEGSLLRSGVFGNSGFTPQRPLWVATWVWMIQATISLTPLPGTLGRAFLHSSLALVIAPRNLRRRDHLVRQVEGSLAFACLAISLVLWHWEPPGGFVPLWPFWVVFGLLIWAGRDAEAGSRERSELRQLLAAADASTDDAPLVRWWKTLKLRRTLRQERAEAVDETRLDAVLDKLHRQGADSLTAAEQALLRRVSQRIRRSRS